MNELPATELTRRNSRVLTRTPGYVGARALVPKRRPLRKGYTFGGLCPEHGGDWELGLLFGSGDIGFSFLRGEAATYWATWGGALGLRDCT